MIAIRLAETSDIAHMSALLDTLFTLESDFVVDAEKQTRGLMQLLATDTAGVWVAENLETLEVVGMCSVQTLISTAEGGRVGLLEDLIVASVFRQQGIASQLLAQAKHWAEKRGLTRLQLLADKYNQPALDFYARQGWQATQLIGLRLGLKD